MARNAEREAIKVKIEILQSVARAFKEITHREEVARKGFAMGKNINMYDAGEKIGKLALKSIRKWKEERDHYEVLKKTLDIQKREGKAWREKESQEKEGKPGPNTKCHGSQTIPESRLRQCGRCHKAYYCKIECQKKAWRQHKTQCRLDGPPTKRETWPI